ncbi:MAG: KH domain-containing protein [Erysipelotrichales bacterium]|nr:KH domain-containing protein [Erysipelotrichales bacterium]
MINYENVLLELVKPMADDPSSITVKQMESLYDDEILLHVYAKNDDIARLIGRKGQMAKAIRDTLAIAGRSEGKRIVVKFEEY